MAVVAAMSRNNSHNQAYFLLAVSKVRYAVLADAINTILTCFYAWINKSMLSKQSMLL